MTNRFTGRAAVITGGSTGMGLATTMRFVDEGMDQVFITVRRHDTIDAVVAEIDRLFYTVGRQNRSIGVLFANAGVAEPRPFEFVDEGFLDASGEASYVNGLELFVDGSVAQL